MAIINRYYSMGRRDDVKKTNKFGFVCPTPSPSRAASPAASCTSSPTSSPGSTCSSVSFFEEKDERRLFLEQVASEVLSTRATKFWMNSMVTEQNIKMMIREYGIPNDMRTHLWAKFIQTKLQGQHHDLNHLLQLSRETIKTTDINEDATLRQIELDLYRTMPNHEMFESTIGVSLIVEHSIMKFKFAVRSKSWGGSWSPIASTWILLMVTVRQWISSLLSFWSSFTATSHSRSAAWFASLIITFPANTLTTT